VKPSENEHPCRLIAVDHVELEAEPQREADLLWFYGELIGLRLTEGDQSGDTQQTRTLRFRSDRWELRVRLVASPAIEAIACRACFEVRNFAAIRDALDEKRWEYEYVRGLRYTERHLSLLDPAGNRVIIRRHWPTTLL